MLGLLSPSRFQELSIIFAVNGILVLKFGDLRQKLLIFVALLPSGRKFLWGGGYLAFKSFSWSPLTWTGERSKEVWHRLLRRAVESHIDKELLRIGGLAEKDLLAFIENGDLVETVVSGLGSLVNGNR